MTVLDSSEAKKVVLQYFKYKEEQSNTQIKRTEEQSNTAINRTEEQSNT
jgi:hypothetical protein